MPAYISLKHNCRRFQSTWVPDPRVPISERFKVIPHPPDEWDHLDLDTYEGIRRKRSTKKTHRNNSSWSPKGQEETPENADLKNQKRSSMDVPAESPSESLLESCGSALTEFHLSTPDMPLSTSASTEIATIVNKTTSGPSDKESVGNVLVEKAKPRGEPSTEGIPTNRCGSSQQSAATTLQGDDMQDLKSKEKKPVKALAQRSTPMARPMRGPIMLVPRPADWKPKAKPVKEKRPLVVTPVDCSGCGMSLLGTSAYACIFPTCHVLFCRRCACQMNQHWDDGGVCGNLAELKKKLILEKGGPEADALRAASVKEAEAAAIAARPKKGVATGAAIAKMLMARQREQQAFAERWGRSLD